MLFEVVSMLQNYYPRWNSKLSIRTSNFWIPIVPIVISVHSFHVVYRDLKPENILLDFTGHIALCDFGTSTFRRRGNLIYPFIHLSVCLRIV